MSSSMSSGSSSSVSTFFFRRLLRLFAEPYYFVIIILLRRALWFGRHKVLSKHLFLNLESFYNDFRHMLVTCGKGYKRTFLEQKDAALHRDGILTRRRGGGSGLTWRRFARRLSLADDARNDGPCAQTT